jgi:hypothetical protein
MDLKTELRWLVKGSNRVLQYRNMQHGTDYSGTDPKTNSFIKTTIWSDWIDVPEFTTIGDDDDYA